jgi:hypothetical protein
MKVQLTCSFQNELENGMENYNIQIMTTNGKRFVQQQILKMVRNMNDNLTFKSKMHVGCPCYTKLHAWRWLHM